MVYEVKIEKLARAELDEAIAWYGLQRDGLDQMLFDVVADTIKSISKRPLAYSIFLAPYRKIRLRKFPYMLVFHLDESRQLVTVLSFWHTSRDPELLSSNLKLYE